MVLDAEDDLSSAACAVHPGQLVAVPVWAERESVRNSGSVLVAGVREAVAAGAGLDDVPAEGETVHDRGAEPGIGEGLGPAA